MANSEIFEQIDVLVTLDKLEDALQLVKTLENSLSKVRALLQIARKFEYRRKQLEQAQDAWIQALDSAQLILDTTQRSEAIAHVATASDSFESFKKPEVDAGILQALQALPEDYSKFNALLRLKYFDQALQTAQKLENGYLKVDALIRIITERAYGQSEQVFKVWQQAINVAQAIASLDEREKALVLVIQSVEYATSYTKLTRSGYQIETRSDRRAEVYAQAIHIAQSLGKSEDKNLAIYNLARQLAADQETDQAIQLINENDITVSVPLNPSIFDPAPTEFYKWVEQTGVREAYCFTDSPSFDGWSVLRVWSEENQPTCWYAFAMQRREKQWKLSLKDFSTLLTAIEESQFWHSVTWDLHRGLDGTTWLFEGWREGKYKCLRAWCPKNGAPYKLGLAFSKLFPKGFKKIQIN